MLKRQPPVRKKILRVRTSDAEEKAIADAAELSGMEVSTWARMVLWEAAIARLRLFGRMVEL